MLILAAGMLAAGCTRKAPSPEFVVFPIAPSCSVELSGDTTTVNVVGSLQSTDDEEPLRRDVADALLAEIGSRLRLPAALRVDTYLPYARLGGARPESREPGFPSLSAVVEFRARRDGPPDRISLIASSLSPHFDIALYQAVERMARDRAGVLPADSPSPRMLRLRVETLPATDTTQRTVLFQMRAPVVRFDTLVTWMPDNPKPTHPRHLQEARVEGGVTLRFVVDPGGRAVLPSMVVHQADDDAFVDAVAVALMFSRFHPATISGCPVASVVEMHYRFAIW